MRGKILSAAILLFLAGFIAGAVVSHTFWPRKEFVPPPPFRGGPPLPATAWRLNLVQRLARDLDLTQEQQQQIDQIIREGQQRLRALWEPIAPEARKTMSEIHKQINQVLTPEQRKLYEQMMRARLHRFHRPPPRRPRKEERPHKGPITNKLKQTNLLHPPPHPPPRRMPFPLQKPPRRPPSLTNPPSTNTPPTR